MLSSILLLAVAGVATCSPLSTRERYPPPTQSKGFYLVANFTDPKRDIFGGALNFWRLTGAHVGAGLQTAVLGSPVHGSDVFWENATTADATTVNVDRALYPGGISIQQPQKGGSYDDNNVMYMGINLGSGTLNVTIDGMELAGPDREGTFVVCNETDTATRPQYPVRWVKVLPRVWGSCSAIRLLADCANFLPPLVDGAEYNHDAVQPVWCYNDIAHIDWTKWSR